MKKKYISLQELNFKNAGLNKMSLFEIVNINGGDFWGSVLTVVGIIAIVVAVSLTLGAAAATGTLIATSAGVSGYMTSGMAALYLGGAASIYAGNEINKNSKQIK